MISRRTAIGATVLCLLVAALGLVVYTQQRIAGCGAVPLLAPQLLANADFATPDPAGALPLGWGAAAPGVALRGPGEGFDLDGDGRAMQLIGIANYLELPAVTVRPGASYCFLGYALTDSVLASPTRARVTFAWSDGAGAALGEDHSPWQPVALWRPEAPPEGWSPLRASFRAPEGAASLRVRVAPASDDRVYLDVMQVRAGGRPAEASPPPDPAAPALSPWPDGRRAAVAFTFDWETTMGGLVHSRSVDDPRADGDPVERGLRMREGITTTLALFAPYDVRATYYATGYNFLLGNREGRTFMGDPTFGWAGTDNRWTSDRWTMTPWFADDPRGTVASHPAWYFGDLVPRLAAAGHEIQSHTFSHFYGGLADPAAWRLDLAAWAEVAAERGVAPATSLAFPWSSSAGMSDASWEELARAGITSVTRMSDQAQYNLFPQGPDGIVAEPRCRPLPAHPQILACPDFYLTEQSADRALRQIERAIAAEGMIDLWAHTEEVVTPAQIAAWERVVGYAANHPDVWVAPLGEIAAWQQALGQVIVEAAPAADGALAVTVTNRSARDLRGLTLRFPYPLRQASVAGDPLSPADLLGQAVSLDLAAGAAVEVLIWPA